VNPETGQFYHKDTQQLKKLLIDISYESGKMTYPATVNHPAPDYKVSCSYSHIEYYTLVTKHIHIVATYYLNISCTVVYI